MKRLFITHLIVKILFTLSQVVVRCVKKRVATKTANIYFGGASMNDAKVLEFIREKLVRSSTKRKLVKATDIISKDGLAMEYFVHKCSVETLLNLKRVLQNELTSSAASKEV